MNFARSKQALLLFLALFLCLNHAISAADDWLPVTSEEKEMKVGKVDPNADVEAIFWEVRIDDSSEFDLTMKHYVRVKIFNERGRERFAKHDIEYVKGEMRIKDLAARVIRPDGTIVEVPEKDFFDREIVRVSGTKVRARSFAVPNIEPGAIVEYRYKEIIEETGATGMTLDLMRDLPVQSLRYYYRPFNRKAPMFRAYNAQNVSFVKDQKDFYLLERKNVPAFEEEPRMPPVRSVKPWIKLQNSAVQVSGPDSELLNQLMESINSQVYWTRFMQSEMPKALLMAKPEKEIKQATTEVIAGASSDEEKLNRIYDYCQKNLKNITYDEATEEDRKNIRKITKLPELLKYKVATGPQIDLLFGSMATAAGFKAAIVHSANRSRMFFDPKMADRTMVHQAAIAVQVGPDAWKYFNPGVPVLPPGKLVWFEEDVWAMIIDEKQNRWRQTPITRHEESVSKRTGRFKLNENGSLEGDVKIEFVGQNAVTRRLDLYSDTDEMRIESVTNDVKRAIPDAEVTTVSVDNVRDYSKPLTYSYKITIPKFAEKTGKRLFLRPSVFEFGRQAVFSASKRKYGIYFTYPWSEKDDIQIMWPEGFELDNADKPQDVADPSNITSLKTKISADLKGRTLFFQREFHFGGGKVPNYFFDVENYEPLKNLFDTFHKIDNHTISLKTK